MPELPEVEYTRRNLVRWMQGAKIVSVETNDALIVKPKPKAFTAHVTGRTVEKIERKGKWLRLVLDRSSLFVHLGMTGWFEREADRFVRVRLVVEKKKKKSEILYVDPRRWGRFVYADILPSWEALGPDPLADGIDRAALSATLAKRKRTVKEVLMDQSVLAGVGNIQAIEALWKARIDPRSASRALTGSDVRAIADGIDWTIERTLEDLSGKKENPFLIYGKKGEPCPRCETPLVRIMLGGRTTTLCPGCQQRKTVRSR